MKRIIIFAALMLAFTHLANAQSEIPAGYELVDSVIYRPAASVDSTLVGRNIFSIMPSTAKGDDTQVNVFQSQEILNSMDSHLTYNEKKTMTGYRIRIFFDNKQTARNESEATMARFLKTYHGIPAYRTYANPYFKVSVGDFRTKSEAMEFLEEIKHNFPGAFVTKETISYPVIDRQNSFVTDTIKVLRKTMVQ